MKFQFKDCFVRARCFINPKDILCVCSLLLNLCRYPQKVLCLSNSWHLVALVPKTYCDIFGYFYNTIFGDGYFWAASSYRSPPKHLCLSNSCIKWSLLSSSVAWIFTYLSRLGIFPPIDMRDIFWQDTISSVREDSKSVKYTSSVAWIFTYYPQLGNFPDGSIDMHFVTRHTISFSEKIPNPFSFVVLLLKSS